MRQSIQFHIAQRQPFEFLVEDRSAGSEVRVVVDTLEPGAHLLQRAMRGEISVLRRQPVAARLQRLAGEDLDAIAADRLEVQRHDASVDLGAAAAMADIGVHVIGEIEHRGAARQVHDAALRRQQVNAVFEDVGLESGEQRVVVWLVLGSLASSSWRIHAILRSKL